LGNLNRMPELAEVEYYRKQWTPGIGQTVAVVRLHAEKRIFRGVDPAALAKHLPGQRLERSQTHGKQMSFVFGGQHWLGVHLGMTGKTAAQDADYRPAKHDHLVIEMSSGLKLIFSDPRLFGRIHYTRSQAPPAWWAELPPEILSEGFTEVRMQQFLQRRAKAPIKAVLLMQETFPGIGNWMADEILYQCRINPNRQSGSLSCKESESLYKTVKYVSREALRIIGTDWGDLPDSWLFNHRWKDGGICPKTGGKLLREKIGGRTTCWSPSWQG